MLTTAGFGPLVPSVGSKHCRPSRAAQGIFRLHYFVNGFQKPVGFFLQFLYGYFFVVFMLKHLVGYVQERQNH